MNNLSAGNAIGPKSSKSTSPLSQRRDLTERINRYVNHCRIIMTHSHSSLYKTTTRWNALDFALELQRHCSNGGSVRELCRHALQIKHHLYALLPLQSNASYNRSLADINGIIDFCKTILTPKTYVH